MTPSEIIRTENMGAKMIKYFPENILGTGFMSAIKELFPGLLFMPTGRVYLDKENIAGWFKEGACAVGIGSKLVNNKLMKAKDYTTIEKATKEVLEVIVSIKK